MLKNLWRALRELRDKLAHILLIPVIATLKAVIAFLTHLETELEKI